MRSAEVHQHGDIVRFHSSNKAMMRVFEKAGFPIPARLEGGVYELTLAFTPEGDRSGD